MPACEQINGAHVRRARAWPAHRDYYLAPRIYAYIQQYNWDLIHLQSYHTLVAPLTMFAARKARAHLLRFARLALGVASSLMPLPAAYELAVAKQHE